MDTQLSIMPYFPWTAMTLPRGGGWQKAAALRWLLTGEGCSGHRRTFGVPSSVAYGATFPQWGKVILVLKRRRFLRQSADWLRMTIGGNARLVRQAHKKQGATAPFHGEMAP